jgi:hypothetical protein
MDMNSNAYRIVQESTGQLPKKSRGKSRAGKLGGVARAKSLSHSKRVEIAQRANAARWKGGSHERDNAARPTKNS